MVVVPISWEQKRATRRRESEPFGKEGVATPTIGERGREKLLGPQNFAPHWRQRRQPQIAGVHLPQRPMTWARKKKGLFHFLIGRVQFYS